MPYMPAVAATLAIPDGGDAPEYLAFKIAMDALADSASMQEIGVKIVTYSASIDESERTKPAPAESDLPYIRASIRAVNSQMETERRHRVMMVLKFEMFVAGLSERDLLNLAHRVRRAFYPADQDQYAAIQGALNLAGSGRARISIQAGAIGAIGESEHGLKAHLDLNLTMLVQT